MVTKSIYLNTSSWIFGILVFAIGAVNTFWGNDPGFGIFLLLLSFVYFPPANVLFQKVTGFRIPWLAKTFLGLFILWAALGVGELFDKIDIMSQDLGYSFNEGWHDPEEVNDELFEFMIWVFV